MERYPEDSGRLRLQAKLRMLAPNAWYRKPPDNRLTYPCFVYTGDAPQVHRADNRGYLLFPRYEVLYITDTEEDSIVQVMLDEFPHCTAGRKYVSDNLYHYPFTIYYK